MIAKDMKYTALYWALRFVETELDVYIKEYGGYRVTIYADRQEVDFGKRIYCDVGHYPLKRHKDFVVLEVVDRLLSNSYKPEEIQVSEDAILTARGETIRCEAWEDYPAAKAQSDNCGTLYTSRLVSGLLECRGMQKGIPFGSGANPPLCKASSDFLIDGDELV